MSVLEQQGADSLHQVKLQMYCRLCGEYKKGMCSNKFRFQADLQRYLSLDVCPDAPSVHPGKICTGCMAYLKRLKVYYRRTRSLKEPRKTAVFKPHSSPCRICDSTHSESPCKRSCPSEFPAPGPRTLPSGAQSDDEVKAKQMRRSSADNFEGDKWPTVLDSGPAYHPEPSPPSTSRGEPSNASLVVPHTDQSYITKSTSAPSTSTFSEPVPSSSGGKPSSATQAITHAESALLTTLVLSQSQLSQPVVSSSDGEPSSTSKAVSHLGASHFSKPTQSNSLGKCPSAGEALSPADSHIMQSTVSNSQGKPSSTTNAVSHAGTSHHPAPSSTQSTSHGEPSSTSKPSEAETITINMIKCNSTPLYKFVSKTQANVFLCAKGTGVACNPRLTPCGHLFCYDCIRASLASANRCPKCQRTIYANQLRALDDCLVTLYYNLKVSCMYGEKGCVQNVVLRDLKKHEEKCSFRRDLEICEEEHSLPHDSETHTDKRRCRGKGKAKVPLSKCSSQYAKRQRLPYIISSVDRFCSDHLEDKKDVLFFMLLNHLRETHDKRSSNLYNMWMAGDVDIEDEAPPVPRNQTCGICHEAGHNRKTCPNT
ncbi:uncharacterized protein LOC118423573 [Branchiostoma floridae]|uniref:V(D)J recombination-activating protein 1 n=1 Tax=Branchiostoma floridae TaxID=7739 RepID=A0A9J7LSB6_BRAFL|nr:uncharacterized protein LOC118423573 [Branchiostoma floridae]